MDDKPVLALGLNYTVTPMNLPTDEIIASTEATIRQLDVLTAENTRESSHPVLSQPKV